MLGALSLRLVDWSIRHFSASHECGLLAGGRVLPWSFAGYLRPVRLRPATPVELLTPPATVAAIAAGYQPMLHPSARALLASSG